jgi:hypothetical protein
VANTFATRFTDGRWRRQTFVRRLLIAMAQVIPTLDAMVQMGRRPGFRALVQERLLTILEAAQQMQKLPGGHVDRSAPLVVQIDDCEVSYSLDLEHDSVQVLAVEPFAEGRAPLNRLFGWRLVSR